MTIEDNGVGISQPNINKLFSNYARLEEHQSMNAKGTGLGLSICKNIIEQMGGRVYVESEVGVGTKFQIIVQLKATYRVGSKIEYNFTENFKRCFKEVTDNQRDDNMMEFQFNSIEE